MAELSTLQQFGIIAGIAGFFISLLNAWNAWRQNRPIMTIHARHPADDDLEVTIENPSARPITLRQSRCWPEKAHKLAPQFEETRQVVTSSVFGDVNWIVPPKTTAHFSLIPGNGGGFLLLVFWHSNSMFLFSRLPWFFC